MARVNDKVIAMHDIPSYVLCRRAFDTDKLVKDFPPRLQDRNKQIVYRLACPPGCRHGGQLMFSRWRKMPLPRTVPAGGRQTKFEAREDVFGYEPLPDGNSKVEWYLNFADSHLFCAYGGPLFAQDEMQVAEHPALGSLREALVRSDLKPLTTEDNQPTPVLVKGVERRCAIATEPNANEGRLLGLYGNHFARASPDAIERATRPIHPPTLSNLIAMAAPSYGQRAYSLEEIEYILATAFTGFTATRFESAPENSSTSAEVVVHTGFWGCGAFGGNRVLMTLLQLLAAGLSQIDHLVFHTHLPAGSAAFQQAREILHDDIFRQGHPVEVASLLKQIQEMRFQWGVSDGN